MMEFNQTPDTSSKSKFNLWLITTIILAVFLIAGGVVFAWQKSASDKIKNDLQSQINDLQNQVQQLTKIIPTDETADWQTYTNEKYGYEIKYPSDWLIDDYSGPNMTDKFSMVSFGLTKNPAPDQNVASEISVTTNFDLDSLNNGFVPQQSLPLKNILPTDINNNAREVFLANNNVSAIEITSPGIELTTELWFMDSNNRLYRIDYPEATKYQQTIQQMLATFKFTK